MNFGYLIFATSNDSIDYLDLAYALAISIKLTQKEGFDQVALVIDDSDRLSKLKSPWVFNHVIEVAVDETGWNPRSRMYELTPFDNTVCLDSDMLFFRDHSHVIEPLIKSEIDLFFPSKAYTYRGEVVSDDYYRKTFTENLLPNIYSFFSFFKKNSERANEFFSLARWIINRPEDFKNQFLSNKIPKIVGTDESLALSAKLLGISDSVTFDTDIIKVVHLKPMIQQWPWPTEEVFDHVGFYFDIDSQLKIGNYQQLDILHYFKKEVITEEVISIMENKLWKK